MTLTFGRRYGKVGDEITVWEAHYGSLASQGAEDLAQPAYDRIAIPESQLGFPQQPCARGAAALATPRSRSAACLSLNKHKGACRFVHCRDIAGATTLLR